MRLKELILKRPVIAICGAYCLCLVILNAAGFFSPENQSFLHYFTNYRKPVILEGKVISEPETAKNAKRFILKTFQINDFKAKEKVLVNCPQGYGVSFGDIIKIEGIIKKPPKAPFPLIFDYSAYLARDAVYTVFDAQYFEYIKSDASKIEKTALNLRKDITQKIDAYFKKAYADILKPVIIGDKSSLTPEVKNNFIDAGLMHILVVSGLNVGFIGVLFLLSFKCAGLNLKAASLAVIPVIFLYALAAGANPPVLRAAIMFSCILISLALDREPLIYNSIALSALIILILQPQQLFSASFQMSYIATIGIIYFYNGIYSVFSGVKNKILRFFCAAFAVTLSAQILLIPICMYYFGKISFISFAANVLVVPAMGITLYLSVIFYIFTFIFPFVSLVISLILSAIVHIVLTLTIFFGGLKFASVYVPKPEIAQIALFFIFIFFASYFKDKKRFVCMLAVIALNCALLIIPACRNYGRPYFKAYYSKNVATLHFKNKEGDFFTLYQNGKYYDGRYIESFKEFLRLSGIKNPQISAAGFPQDKLKKDLSGYSVTIIERAGKALPANI
ncbi:MAG: ComEC family competence protein [Endomicrobium sp.]|jgi:competence protein ComEC|nr:ComEC family competence protein [Endomicrobium sp.]